MKVHPRRVPFVAALTVIALTTAFSPAPAAAQDESAPEPGYFVVTSDIDVRSGAADSYYPFGRLERGDVIKVVGEKYEWARVVTAGPAFEEFFGFLRYPQTEAARFKVEPDGQRGRTQGMTRVLAPNMNTGYDPNDSWKRILLLESERDVTVLETHDDGRLVVHKIVLPPDAEGWVNKRFLEPATEAQIAAWKTAVTSGPQPPKTTGGALRQQAAAPAPAPGAKAGAKAGGGTARAAADPVLARDEPVVESVTPPATTRDALATPQTPRNARSLAGERLDTGRETPAEDTTSSSGAALEIVAPTTLAAPAIEPEKGLTMGPTGPPAPPRTPKERLEDLEEAYARLREEPIATAEVVPMRALYLDLADASVNDDDVFRYAQARAEQLAIWADLQARRTELSTVRQRLDLTAEEARAVRLALDAKGVYAAVGRLSASTVYDGSRLPRLLRIQEPSSGRTICYVQPDTAFDYYRMLGQLIGVVGRKYRSEELGVNVVEPKRIDLLAGQTG